MTSTRQKLAVLGSGSWGTALAIHFAKQGHCVHLWGRNASDVAHMRASRCNRRYLPDIVFPDNLTPTPSLSAALDQASAVLLVVPSGAFRSMISALIPHIHKDTLIMWGTKGLDRSGGSPQLLHHVVASVLGKDQPMAMLSGPSFAQEVAEGLPAAVTVSGNGALVIERVIATFHTPYLRLYANQDFVGVQVGAAMKNIMAVATGINDGLGLGSSAKAALMTRGLLEMTHLGVAMGAQKETFMGLSGVGDLMLTCTGDLSRNRRFGLALGRGIDKETALQQIGQSVESLDNVTEIYALGRQYGVSTPITEQVYHIVAHDRPCAAAVEQLLSHPPMKDA